MPAPKNNRNNRKPEAAKASGTIIMRLPLARKGRIVQAARKAGQSLTQYILSRLPE